MEKRKKIRQTRLPRRRARRNLSSRPNGGGSIAPPTLSQEESHDADLDGEDVDSQAADKFVRKRKGPKIDSARVSESLFSQTACGSNLCVRHRPGAKDAICTGTPRKTFFGEGAARARLMFVGERPGDEEDLTGHPFVRTAHPAGCCVKPCRRRRIHARDVLHHERGKALPSSSSTESAAFTQSRRSRKFERASRGWKPKSHGGAQTQSLRWARRRLRFCSDRRFRLASIARS